MFRKLHPSLFMLLLWLHAAFVLAEERRKSFDREPGWEGHNNRAKTPEPQTVRQDFGYSSTNHAGGKSPGEIGGFMTPAGENAYYARRIPAATLDQRLSASGRLACTDRHFHALLGFFNADTINEWRTPNSILIRLYGRGDVFYAYVEYCTGRWRAGGDSPGGFATLDEPGTGKKTLKGFAGNGTSHTWSLDYDPQGNGGSGSITVKIDNEVAVCHLDEGHKKDGAAFNRFGLLSIPKHFDTGGALWIDDVSVNGDLERFDRDPNWDALGNRRTYMTYDVRPRFDFGFSNTQFAGGKGQGELGGLVFRGDCRTAEKLAYYGDRVAGLSSAKPLRASGKVALARGVSDSTSLIGFFHSQESVKVSDSQSSGFPMNFLGAAIEGPSREGFLFYPVYRFAGGDASYARGDDLPHILPDGKPHDWSLVYEPGAAGGNGGIVVTFDGQEARLDIARGNDDKPTSFDRFGIVTTWIDGNAQRVYFDDLSYTARQSE
jgi:hypothetical protein